MAKRTVSQVCSRESKLDLHLFTIQPLCGSVFWMQIRIHTIKSRQRNTSEVKLSSHYYVLYNFLTDFFLRIKCIIKTILKSYFQNCAQRIGSDTGPISKSGSGSKYNAFGSTKLLKTTLCRSYLHPDHYTGLQGLTLRQFHVTLSL